MTPIDKKILKKITPFIWEIPVSFRHDMKVAARIFTSEKMLDEVLKDNSINQLINVSTLPGIQQNALVMPDVHEGYGFPIGGVAAFEYPDGVISPGGIGYDINCGVRLLKSNQKITDLNHRQGLLAKRMYEEIPSGVGQGGKLKLKDKELDQVLSQGAGFMVRNGFGKETDTDFLESKGQLENADPSLVSQHAKDRGRNQLGTMGAGNHFVEVDYVAEIFDEEIGEKFGLFPDQVVVLIHTGSRGLGHQVATDYIRIMLNSLSKYNISLSDRELACAPFSSKEGTNYFNAMTAAANFAWTNRQVITHEVRTVWKEFFSDDLEILYDIAHNIAKIEEHNINGNTEKVIVHRKGATRAFPDQPVLIPGSMGTASYVLAGTEGSMRQSFGSTCHGAGRRMSRHQALREVNGKKLKMDLEDQGIFIQTGSIRGLAEEAPVAYKNIDNVIDVVSAAGICQKVARLKPIAVIKG